MNVNNTTNMLDGYNTNQGINNSNANYEVFKNIREKIRNFSDKVTSNVVEILSNVGSESTGGIGGGGGNTSFTPHDWIQ